MSERFVIENANLAPSKFRNFSGLETAFNKKGDRNFVLFLDNETAKKLEAKGAPVNWKPDRYNEGEMRAQLKVHVKYRDRQGNRLTPPNVVLVTSHGQTKLDEDTIGMLDTAEIEKTDLILNMYSYTSPMGSGNSVALKTLYATLAEDELEEKYRQEEEPF